jgi:hypothetical protein
MIMADHDASALRVKHHPGARKGKEILDDEGKEADRRDKGQSGQGCPAAGSTARG